MPLDPDASTWVHTFSVAGCVLLVCSALLALAFQRPGSLKLKPGMPAAAAGATQPPPPTVESLGTQPSSAHVAGALTRQGDVIEAGAKPVCFALEGAGEVCLGPQARARIGAPRPSACRFELLAGRAVISCEATASSPLLAGIDALRIASSDGVLGLEFDGEQASVRVLRGAVHVEGGGRDATLSRAQAALYSVRTRSLDVVPQVNERARGDWELLATRAAPR